ncbi:hypothetical protein [Halostella litorea]|uniref:hypothetical protein n=1 Tax=Halostella litorea TaxID=2528831 RepID=UPI0010933480|nr:hypothetical protein [Halostella litorea]
MPTFDIDRERINLFHVGFEYIFSEYFDQDELFQDLNPYYDPDQYRFAVPADEIDDITSRLEDAYYDPVLVEDLEPYCVVKEKYTKHADILRESVATWERRGNLFFLLPDELTVTEAIEAGATPIEDTEFIVGL